MQVEDNGGEIIIYSVHEGFGDEMKYMIFMMIPVKMANWPVAPD